MFPAPALDFVTHRHPMLLVSSLVKREETVGIIEATVPESGPMVNDGSVLSEYLVEIVAQSMAVVDGYDAMCAGKAPSGGLLVGLKCFKILALPSPGQKLNIVLKKLVEFGPMTVMEGTVTAGNSVLASGELKVWTPEE